MIRSYEHRLRHRRLVKAIGQLLPNGGEILNEDRVHVRWRIGIVAAALDPRRLCRAVHAVERIHVVRAAEERNAHQERIVLNFLKISLAACAAAGDERSGVSARVLGRVF